MHKTWNLDSLYTALSSPAYRQDVEALKGLRDGLCRYFSAAFGQPKSPTLLSPKVLGAALTDGLKLMEDFLVLYSRLHSYAMFLSQEDLTNTQATAARSELQGIQSALAPCRAMLSQYLAQNEVVFRSCLADCALAPLRPYLERLMADSTHLLPPEQEKLLATLRDTGSDSWARAQSRALAKATATVMVAGEPRQIPLAQMGGLPPAQNQAEQEQRFFAELHALEGCADLSAEALCAIKGEVITVARLRGFSTPLDLSLDEFGLSAETLDCLIESVAKYLPALCGYYKMKAAYLDLPQGLPYALRETPIFPSARRYEWGEAKEMILNAFVSYSARMYRFGKRAFDEDWIHFEPMANKVAGASCDGIYAVKESRLRLHYNKTLGDVNSLAHELGHGYHNLNLFEGRMLDYGYDMPITETAAKFSELLFKHSLTTILPPQEALVIEDFMVSSLVNTVADIQSRFYFEQEFFKRRLTSEPRAADISSMMLDAQKKAYGDSLDPRLLHPYMWVNKPHYYFPNRNYYNFPYSFGALLSVAMYDRFKADPKAFIEDYDKFLANTGRMRARELCTMLGFDINDKAFWCSTLKSLVAMVDALAAKLVPALL